MSVLPSTKKNNVLLCDKLLPLTQLERVLLPWLLYNTATLTPIWRGYCYHGYCITPPHSPLSGRVLLPWLLYNTAPLTAIWRGYCYHGYCITLLYNTTSLTPICRNFARSSFGVRRYWSRPSFQRILSRTSRSPPTSQSPLS
jgi:hypothetical protein